MVVYSEDISYRSMRLAKHLNELYAYDPLTGQKQKSYFGETQFSTKPIVTQNGKVIIGDNKGRLLFLH